MVFAQGAFDERRLQHRIPRGRSLKAELVRVGGAGGERPGQLDGHLGDGAQRRPRFFGRDGGSLDDPHGVAGVSGRGVAPEDKLLVGRHRDRHGGGRRARKGQPGDRQAVPAAILDDEVGGDLLAADVVVDGATQPQVRAGGDRDPHLARSVGADDAFVGGPGDGGAFPFVPEIAAEAEAPVRDRR